MRNSVLFVVIAVVSFVAGTFYADRELREANAFKAELLRAYDKYYDGVEQLLNTLEDEYNWVDAFDPYEYYEGKELVDSLYATQL